MFYSHHDDLLSAFGFTPIGRAQPLGQAAALLDTHVSITYYRSLMQTAPRFYRACKGSYATPFRVRVQPIFLP